MMSPRPGDPSTWLAAALDALPVAVVLADVDGRLVAANRMAVRLLAIPPEVTKLTEVVTLDGIPGLAEAVSVARAEGGTQRIGTSRWGLPANVSTSPSAA
jgi:PAS domain-containing protein